jgi:large subunit ribosomal protein L9
VNEKEELYGSVSGLDISLAIKEEGFLIDKENIKLDQTIKQLGIYEVPLKLHPQVETKIKIWVVKK